MRHFHTVFVLAYCIVVTLAVIAMAILRVSEPPAILMVLFFAATAIVFIPMKLVFSDRDFYRLGWSMLYYVLAAAIVGGLYALIFPHKPADFPLVAAIIAFFLYYLPARAIMRLDGEC